MIQRKLAAAGVAGLFAACLFAQTPPPAKKTEAAKPAAGRRAPARAAQAPARRFPIDYVHTNQSKTDWEEINFEFNSSIISDGFPTMLYLADFLNSHRDHKVTITGNTDYVGSNSYNDALARARADSVAAFLQKYGVQAGQITTRAEGKRQPEVSNNTKEGRFVNRRVALAVVDGQGRPVPFPPVEAPKPVAAAGSSDCCQDILRKLDELANLIDRLAKREDGEHAKLHDEIDNLQKQIAGIPKPLTRQETTQVVRSEGNTIASNAATRAVEEAARRNKKFSLIGLNIGPTYGKGKTGDFTFSGRGQFFSPFGGSGTHAVQAQGEYMYYPGRQEGQFDIGLVNRWDHVQAGLFGSFKYLNFREFQHGGGLGQGAFMLDYLFKSGRIGLFGTKGFKNIAVLNSQTLAPGSFLETYARIVDQVGVSGLVGLWGDAHLEGNVGFLRGRTRNSGGFSAKLVHPLSEEFALTAEVGLNETYLNTKNSGRVVFGFQFGNFIRPKDYTNVKSPVPMDVPRIRYELLTRRVGATPPVADAGPDQIGVRPGTITLNGSGSFDPVGLALTYRWTQIAGPAVSISGQNAAVATFTAAEGQTYSFRLTVTNTDNLSDSARTTVSTIRVPDINVVRFTATPDTIVRGQCTIIEWNVTNAETIEIQPTIGANLREQGTRQVCPTETTTFTLTANNATNGKSARASLTVTVGAVPASNPRITRFEATPANIIRGESSLLQWATEEATRVTLNGQEVALNGSQAVSPQNTTTYTLMAFGPDNRSVQAQTIVTVSSGQVPRVISFTITPLTIEPGGSAQLCWNVENATTVTISPGIGGVKAMDCITVNPTSTTTYTLTATNGAGPVVATVTLNVGAVKILSFSNTPDFSQIAGTKVTVCWSTQNAASVSLTGLGVPSGTLPVNGCVDIFPITNSDYTLIAYGSNGQSVSAVLHVFVR
jgi:outer membrane protein OmpA-like peptidoglycan-associated protein